jgi:hypothetical protein
MNYLKSTKWMPVTCAILFLSACQEPAKNCTSQETQITSLQRQIDSLNYVISTLQTKNERKVVKTKKAKQQPIVTTTSNSYQSDNAPQSYSGSRQCMGTTKKGLRCRRMVRSGNYCWQHGG